MLGGKDYIYNYQEEKFSLRRIASSFGERGRKGWATNKQCVRRERGLLFNSREKRVCGNPTD